MRRIRTFASAVSILTTLFVAHTAQAATITVTPDDLNGWSLGTATSGAAAFVEGPATPPAGTGSVSLSIGANSGSARSRVQTSDFGGVLLSDLTELKYSTYVDNFGNTGSAIPILVIGVDTNSDTFADLLLTFEAADNTSQHATVTIDTWLDWDVFSGEVKLNAAGVAFSLSSYIASNPTYTIASTLPGGVIGGFRVQTGFDGDLGTAWENYSGYVDSVIVGIDGVSTTYNFEIPEPGSLALMALGGMLVLYRPKARHAV